MKVSVLAMLMALAVLCFACVPSDGDPNSGSIQDSGSSDQQQVRGLPEGEPQQWIGQQAPDFTLARHDKGEFTLASAVQKGPVVLIFYRGVW